MRRYQLAAFVVAGAFAGLAGALFGIFNRGVFPDFAYWSKSAEVLIMAILGGIGSFWGPAVGAAVLILLNQQITAYTQYWPFVLGSILIVLLFVFPGGIVGALHAGVCAHRGGGAMLEVRDIRKTFNGFTAVGGVSLGVPAQRHHRGDRSERRRQVDAVQSPDRPSARRRRQRDVRGTRHHRPPRRTRSAAWASAARSSTPTSSAS